MSGGAFGKHAGPGGTGPLTPPLSLFYTAAAMAHSCSSEGFTMAARWQGWTAVDSFSCRMNNVRIEDEIHTNNFEFPFFLSAKCNYISA